MKNLKLSILILISLIAFDKEISFAQATLEWAKSYSINQLNAQIAYDAVTDTNGNIYVTGNTARGSDVVDMVTIKYSSAGNYIWGKSYDFPGYDYSSETGRSLALYRNGANTFIYSAGIVTFGTYNNILLIKYDENGNQKWVKTFSYAPYGYLNSVPKVISDASGNCYVSGGSGEKQYAVKYDSAGTLIFGSLIHLTSGITRSASYDMAFDTAGNIYLTGDCDSSSTVHYFTSKLNSSGVLQWSKIFRGLVNYQSSARKVAVGSSGSVYVTGEYQSATMDYLTIKYNPVTGDTIWTKRFNGTSGVTDYGRLLVLDASENVYVTGVTNYNGNGDMATIKYNSSGIQQWVKVYSGSGGYLDDPKDMLTDLSGNIYISFACDYSNFGKFGIIKYNSNGDSLWSRKYDFVFPDFETPYAITMDNSGNVISTGSSGYENDSDFGTIKYNSSGALQWARKFNGSQLVNDVANGMVKDKNGNVYTVGTTRTNLGDNITVVKYNSAGVQKWVHNRGGGGVTGYDVRDEGKAIGIDSSGNVYFTGTWYYWATNKNDICTGKLDSNGTSQWFTVENGSGTDYGDDIANDIAVDSAGNVFITGQISGPGGDLNFITIKYNTLGFKQWARGYGAISGGKDIANAIALDQNGNAFVTGTSDGTGTGTNITTIKYSSVGVQQWIKTYDGNSSGNDFGNDIGIDKAGNIYVCGGEGAADPRAVLIKYLNDATGTQHWIKLEDWASSGAFPTYFNALTFDAAKTSVYLTGVQGDYSGSIVSYAKYDTSNTVLGYYNFKISPDYTYTSEGKSIAVDDGFIYIAGNKYTPGSESEIFLMRCRKNGGFLWQEYFNGSSSGKDEVTSKNGIALGNGNNIFIAGSSYDSITGSNITTIKYSYPYFSLETYQFLEGPFTGTPYHYYDTFKVYLRNSVFPYNIVDSSKAVNDVTSPAVSSYVLHTYFSNVSEGVNYYIVLKHRNSIETWSSTVQSFTGGTMYYNFTDNAGRAFGNNLKLLTSSPFPIYGIYSGDVNQDGTIDASDLSDTDNDAIAGLSGYVPTDVTGDDFVDAADMSIVDNNAFNSVSEVRP